MDTRLGGCRDGGEGGGIEGRCTIEGIEPAHVAEAGAVPSKDEEEPLDRCGNPVQAILPDHPRNLAVVVVEDRSGRVIPERRIPRDLAVPGAAPVVVIRGTAGEKAFHVGGNTAGLVPSNDEPREVGVVPSTRSGLPTTEPRTASSHPVARVTSLPPFEPGGRRISRRNGCASVAVPPHRLPGRDCLVLPVRLPFYRLGFSPVHENDEW
jgi:hypothetical protein